MVRVPTLPPQPADAGRTLREGAVVYKGGKTKAVSNAAGSHQRKTASKGIEY